MSARIEALRIPPHSADAEQATLGGLMCNPGALVKIDFLSESDFYQQRHRILFNTIRELIEKGVQPDAVTLGEWLETNGDRELAHYAIQIVNATPGASNIAAYAEIVREKAKLRELIDAGTEMASAAFAPRADASIIAAHASNRVASLVGDARGGGLTSLRGAVSSWMDILQQRYNRGDTITGVHTPWPGLDELTQGLQPSELTIIAGRSNMGKSVAGFQIATFNALSGENTAVHSLEMSAEQFVQRSVAAFAKVPYRSLRRPADLTDAEWHLVTGMTGKLQAAPLHIDAQAGLTAAQVIARMKRQHLRAPLKLAVVDHLHAIKRAGRDPVNELADAAQQFKDAAKALNIPIVLLAQLNRANTSRSDHRPMMSDLRGSGSIEEIGDLIILVHREEYFNRKTHLKGVVEFIIGKGRDVPTGEVVHLQNRYDQMRLEDWEGPLPTKSTAGKSEPRGFVPEGDD